MHELYLDGAPSMDWISIVQMKNSLNTHTSHHPFTMLMNYKITFDLMKSFHQCFMTLMNYKITLDLVNHRFRGEQQPSARSIKKSIENASSHKISVFNCIITRWEYLILAAFSANVRRI